MASVSIKGIRNGLLVALDEDGAWDEVEAALVGTIEERENFFRGARLALQVGGRKLDREEIRKLRDRLAEHDIQLAAILGKSAETIRSARRLNIDTDLDEAATFEELEDGELPPIDQTERGSPAILVKTTLRSGQSISHHGHVIIIGDVNPGAEIIAGGDVLVWGRLRGTVQAGANGDDEALVCALDMRPMQLRIANYVAIATDDGQQRRHPEIASVRDGQIVSEEWGI